MHEFTPQLRKCPILQGLEDPELQSLLDIVKFEDFEQGSEILTEGLRYQSLWVLLQGESTVVKRGMHQESRLANLTPGSVFGEMSFFDSSPHSASVIAKTPCHTMRIMHKDYETLRSTCPETAYKISLNVIQILSDRLRRMDQWTCELVEQDCNQDRHKEWHDFRAKLYTGLDL
ncbi:MAG: cyclic nucleotide-binding domain-containing protein [Planctomycetaceae bacterium]|nr:cyclic nucleotide-binding domain-containing protein [Planctomycetaceae bacterium]